ncbi:MAG: HAD hydrolase family protein, partial [Lachnospiraceae bacterium]|nr:HAD hydrolase family protein [Lachnospiraceae bacterium]
AYAVRTSLEMNAEGVTKASGLARLCGYLGITMDDVMGVGDSYNDRDFLEAVGLSVAMGNSVPEIRELCDEVTDDCSNNGVGAAIRRFCCG